MKHLGIFIIFLSAALMMLTNSCIEDGITSSPSHQPRFSTDTLSLGTVYTDQLTMTSRMTVYNPHSKGLNIERISVTGDNAELFRINVDGLSGKAFSDIEIRAKDSIFVFVEALLPENGQDAPKTVNAYIDFLTNGVSSQVVIAVDGQDVNRMHGIVISADTTLTANKPYQIFDSLVVAEGATLTIEPGAELHFHDKATFDIYGTLISQGTPEMPILITGDRTGDVITGVSFDLMSRQWDSMNFYPPSSGSLVSFTEINNTSYGLAVYGDGSNPDYPKVTFENCRIRNSGECSLLAFNASIHAYGCEIAEAAVSPVYLLGGKHRFDQCTVANNYLFSAISGPCWNIIDPADTEDYADAAPTEALITNCITYGYGGDVMPADLKDTQIFFKRCSFKSEGTDDDNFIECLWDTDPLFYTIRNEYVFNYRVKPESPAIEAANTALTEHPLATDFYGTPRSSDLGAYVYVPQKN